MRTIWRGLVRTIFWSYERMTWQYDVMVLAIVVFVLLAPSRWFHDQRPSSAFAGARVALVAEDTAGGTRTYRLDAAALPLEKRAAKSPELERLTHDILGRTVGELRGRTFQVVRIDPVVADDGFVMSYDVTVR
jgi:hypothetical protein